MTVEETNKEVREKTIWLKLVEFHVNHAYLMLFLIALGSVYFAYQIGGINIKTDFFQLYPPKHPYIQLYKEYRAMFGTANVMSLMVEVKDGDIYNKATLSKVDRITMHLLETKGVNPMQVISITHPRLKDIRVGSNGIDVLPLMHPRIPETPLEERLLKKKVYTNDSIRGIWISPDDKATVIQAGFWEEGVDLGALWERMIALQKQEEDSNTKIHITGYPMLYAWIAHYTPQMYTVFIVTAIVLTLLLWLYFRTLMGVFLPIASALISALWGLGFAAALNINLDPLVLVIPLLLSARALSHSVQAMERYHEEYAISEDKMGAIIRAYGYLYKPGILGLLTDGLGVLTIAVATIPLMRNLAVYGSFWVLTIYVSSIVLSPVLASLLPPPRAKHVDREKLASLGEDASHEELRELTARPGDKFYLKISHALIAMTEGNRKWMVFTAVVLIMVVGGYLAESRLKVGDVSAGKAILYPDHEYNIAYDKVNKEFLGVSQMIVIAEGSKERAMVHSDSLRLIDNMATGSLNIPAVGGAMTITDIIKRISRMYHDQYPKWGIVPNEPSHVGQMFFLIGGSMAPGELDRLISTPSYTNATITIYFREHNNQVIKDAISYLKTYIEENPAEQMKFRLVGGILGILAAVNEEVEWSYWINMALIFGLTFLFCWIAYRSWLGAMVLAIPLLLCQILCDMLMLILGIDMNINSLPVAAIGVGVGVDYGIYVLSRLSEEYQFSNGDFEKARYLAITSTGKAIIFTATTLVLSIIFFAFASFKFQAEMAILLSFLLVANMVASLAVLPSLVSIIGPDRILPKYKV